MQEGCREGRVGTELVTLRGNLRQVNFSVIELFSMWALLKH